jgi:3-oxoadipate enol-lactonase
MPTLEVAGTTLHYLERGDGPVALFVHGFPLDATMWVDQIERLADIRRCIAVDLRGFGGSSLGTAETLPMERLADDLAELLAALHVPAVDLVTLSMGGYVGLALAQLHPGLLRTLALIDTRAEADTPDGKAGRDEAARRVLVDGRREFADGMMPALVATTASPLVRARLRTMMEATPYETILAALAGMRDRPDRTGILRRIAVPTAVIVGAEDVITPLPAAEVMAAGVRNAVLHVIPSVGHMSPMEAPQAVADILRSLFVLGSS